MPGVFRPREMYLQGVGQGGGGRSGVSQQDLKLQLEEIKCCTGSNALLMPGIRDDAPEAGTRRGDQERKRSYQDTAPPQRQCQDRSVCPVVVVVIPQPGVRVKVRHFSEDRVGSSGLAIRTW